MSVDRSGPPYVRCSALRAGVLALGLCLPSTEPTTAQQPAGVLILRDQGYDICHAVAIGSRSIVTALHCVHDRPLAALRVVNPYRLSPEGRIESIADVSPANDSSTDYDPRRDLVLLNLRDDIDLRPASISKGALAPTGVVRATRRSPQDRSNQSFYALHWTETRTSVRDGQLMFMQPSLCDGDSGAPVFDGAGMLLAIVIGVTSHDCASGMTVVARLPTGL